METEYPFHTALFFVLLAIVALRMYYNGYADASSGVRQTIEGEGFFKIIRFVLGIPLGVAFFAYLIWPPVLQFAHLELSSPIRWLGFLICLLGVLVLVSVQKHLSRNFTGTVQIRPGGSVIKTGPYAYVRHPMYWSFLVLGTGFLLLTSNWLFGGGFLFFILIVMIVRTPTEERALLAAYGDEYAQYMKSTGKFSRSSKKASRGLNFMGQGSFLGI